MASYTKYTWETINLGVVSNNSYFIILDHQASGSPNAETTGVIYSGYIPKNFGITHLDELLSQYVQGYELSFANGTQGYDDQQKTFYIYYTQNNWTSYTYDDVTLIYDWSYGNTPSGSVLSSPIIDIVDYRQYLLWTMSSTGGTENIQISLDNETVQTYTPSGNLNYTVVQNLSTWNFPGEFTIAYSYDFLVYRSQMLPGTFNTVTINGTTYYVTNTCYNYCLYYLNQYGGWDSLLFRGKEFQNDKLTRLSYNKPFNSMSTQFGKVDYLTKIEESWELNTSYLNDIQSTKMIQVLSSNNLYLQDLNSGVILPVNITNSNCEHKTYKNQGRKMSTYTVTVTNSQNKYRL